MRRVGTIRQRLAARLEATIPGVTFDARELYPHNAHDIHTGLSSWDGYGYDANGNARSVCSWDSMTECVRAARLGVTADRRGFAYYEVHAEKL